MYVVPERLMPPDNAMEQMIPIHAPELQFMYLQARIQWWYALQSVQRQISEAIHYGPGNVGQNIISACHQVEFYEAATHTIRSADIQLRERKETG